MEVRYSNLVRNGCLAKKSRTARINTSAPSKSTLNLRKKLAQAPRAVNHPLGESARIVISVPTARKIFLTIFAMAMRGCSFIRASRSTPVLNFINLGYRYLERAEGRSARAITDVFRRGVDDHRARGLRLGSGHSIRLIF